jgi:hypothetical protein
MMLITAPNIQSESKTMTATKRIHCCGCGVEVQARLTNGEEIYPHRLDLHALPFWKCDGCGNYVGCHHKTNDRTQPLGNIPTPELRAARGRVHAAIDPLFKSGKYKRKHVYDEISKHLGYEFHAASLRSIDEAQRVVDFARSIGEH